MTNYYQLNIDHTPWKKGDILNQQQIDSNFPDTSWATLLWCKAISYLMVEHIPGSYQGQKEVLEAAFKRNPKLEPLLEHWYTKWLEQWHGDWRKYLDVNPPLRKEQHSGKQTGKAQEISKLGVTLLDLLNDYKVPVRGNKANCPFHADNTPSFSFNNESGLWKCFGCNESGNIVTFIRKMEAMQ